jgi:hypothetical protein
MDRTMDRGTLIVSTTDHLEENLFFGKKNYYEETQFHVDDIVSQTRQKHTQNTGIEIGHT